LKLHDLVGQAVITTPEVTATIHDDETMPEVYLASGGYSVTEGAGPALVTVWLSGLAQGPVTVTLSTQDVSASGGAATDPHGATLGTPSQATVTILDDAPPTVNVLASDGLASEAQASTAELTCTHDGEPVSGLPPRRLPPGDQ